MRLELSVIVAGIPASIGPLDDTISEVPILGVVGVFYCRGEICKLLGVQGKN